MPSACLALWLLLLPTDPLSGQPLSSDALVPNLVLRDMIHAWLQEDPTSTNSRDSGGGNATDSCAGLVSAASARVSRSNSSSPSKDRKGVDSGRDRDVARDEMLPSTPVRKSRDV